MSKRPVIIETQRLFLYEFAPVDAQCFYDLNANKEVMQFTGDEPFKSVDESETFIKNYAAYKEYGFGRWTIVLKEDKTPIGWCGLKQHPSGMVDLGYRLQKQFWGKGYATEAAKACLTYGFEQLGIREIVGRTAKANRASISVLEKLGMTFWKEAPCEGIQDSIYYKITK